VWDYYGVMLFEIIFLVGVEVVCVMRGVRIF
jgi:hypothetical protein